MTPQELADAVGTIVTRAQERVGPGSIGARQYSEPGRPQKFETMPLDDLLVYITEETLDLVNYGCMATIRIDRLREAVGAAEGVIDREAYRCALRDVIARLDAQRPDDAGVLDEPSAVVVRLAREKGIDVFDRPGEEQVA